MKKEKGCNQKIDVTWIILGGPSPYGLKLGLSDTVEVKRVLNKEGGLITNEDRKGPPTLVWHVTKLRMEHLVLSKFWFYEGILFGVEYRFNSSLDKKEFKLTVEKLESHYGPYTKYIEPNKMEAGQAYWKIGDQEVELIVQRVSDTMSLQYCHIPKALEAEQSEKEATLPKVRKKMQVEDGL